MVIIAFGIDDAYFYAFEMSILTAEILCHIYLPG